MLRLTGKLLNVDERSGVNKEGKPYWGANCLILDEDNECHMFRAFDRDGTLKPFVQGLKIGVAVTCKVDKCERLANRTFDCMGEFVRTK